MVPSPTLRPRACLAFLGSLLLLASGCGSGSRPAGSATAPKATQSTRPPSSTSAAPSGTRSQTGGSSPKAASFTVGFPAFSGTFTPLYVASAQGFFQKGGVPVKLHRLPGSGSEMAALQSGSVQLVVISVNTALPAIAKGIDAAVVGVAVPYSAWTIWSKPSIKNLKGLEGHTLGLERVNSSADITVHQLLPKLGVNLSKVKLDYLGNPTTTAAGLVSGKVDAVTVTPPSTIKLKQKGFKQLYDFRKIPHVSEVLVMMKPFASAHPKEVEAFLASWAEAIHFMKQPQNAAQVEKDLGTYIHSKDPSVLKGTLAYYQNIMRCLPSVSASDLSGAVAWTKSHAHQSIDPNSAIDTQFASAIATQAKQKWCPGS